MLQPAASQLQKLIKLHFGITFSSSPGGSLS
jgi:hypothetical protein